MTEGEWLAATAHEPVLEFLQGRASERKLRLRGCAKCHLIHPESDTTTAEQFADGMVTVEVLRATWRTTDSMPWSWPERGYEWAAIMPAAPDPHNRELDPDGFDQVVALRERFLLALRDIFGNPFCPMTVDPVWRTSTVVALATGIYADQAFDRLPILADALQDAGCDSDYMLNHCRGEGPHVRGCWVVDLVLGKE